MTDQGQRSIYLLLEKKSTVKSPKSESNAPVITPRRLFLSFGRTPICSQADLQHKAKD